MITHKSRSKQKQQNQSGLVSIFVVTIIMALLALVVISFTKLMDRELRQVQDRELATQANYAAESGFNDARAAVDQALKNNNLASLDTNGRCLNLSTLTSTFIKNGSISGHYNNSDTDKVIRYTCVIIDTKPKALTDMIARGQSRTYLISPSVPMSNLYLSWEDQAYSGTPQPLEPPPNPPYKLPQEDAVGADNTGMLRATLYPITNALGSANSSDAQNNLLNQASRTYFIYPNSVGVATTAGNISSYSYDALSGLMQRGNCNPNNRNNALYLPYQQAGGRYCNFRWRNVSASGGAFYYLRLTALYQNLKVMIQGADSSNNAVNLNRDQVVIDVTAQGNNILKRVRGSVSIAPQSNLQYPDYALQSMDTVCKRIRLDKVAAGSGAAAYGGATVDDTTGNINIANACQQSGF
jgi:Tfp pilus assembly protein PilX